MATNTLSRAVTLLTRQTLQSSRCTTFNFARRFGVGGEMSDNDPDVLEKEKLKNLQGKTKSWIKDMPGWNERLASDSEAVVKAERCAESSSVEEMERQTIEFLAQRDATEEVTTVSEKTVINHETVTKKKWNTGE